MESERSREIWDLGHSLFAELNGRAISATKLKSHSKLPGIVGIAFGVSHYINECMNPDANAKCAIIRNVINGKLIATGFRTMPTQSREVVRIDADDFGSGQVSWLQNRLVTGELCYAEIRLTRAFRLPERLKASHPNAGERTAAINNLIAELHRSGQITDRPNKTNVGILKAEVERRDIPYGGTSDDNLRRVLRRHFKSN